MTNGPSSDDDDVVDRLDAGEPPRSPEEAVARAPYERLIERIRDLDEIDPPPGWEDRAMARWSRSKRNRLGVAFAVAATTCALAAVILLQLCAAPRGDGLELAVLSKSESPHRGGPSVAGVGDTLQLRVHRSSPHAELRIYLDNAVIARCPGNAACRLDAATIQLDWKLADAGAYQIIVLSSASPIPPGDGFLDRDLLDARAANVRMEAHGLQVSR